MYTRPRKCWIITILKYIHNINKSFDLISMLFFSERLNIYGNKNNGWTLFLQHIQYKITYITLDIYLYPEVDISMIFPYNMEVSMIISHGLNHWSIAPVAWPWPVRSWPVLAAGFSEPIKAGEGFFELWDVEDVSGTDVDVNEGKTGVPGMVSLIGMTWTPCRRI